MEIGERVQVKTFLFEGMATIDYIAAGELYPIQIELDEADDEGHKLKRIKADEIIKGDVLQEVMEQPANGLQLAEIVVNDPGYGLRVGDQYMVGPTKQNVGTHYYFYQPQSMRFIGCMPVGMFRIIGAHNEQPIEPIKVKPVFEEIEPAIKYIIEKLDRKPKKKKQKVNDMPDGQLSLFDFI